MARAQAPHSEPVILIFLIKKYLYAFDLKYFHPITNLMDRGIFRPHPYTRSRMHSIETRERRRRIIKAASAVIGDPRDHDHSVKKCQNYLAHNSQVFIHLKIVL